MTSDRRHPRAKLPRLDRWWARAHPDEDGFLVAYFSLEFGVDASLPIYSGGLGVLAGDHLKAAADLGVPLVGVGLLYRHGYFRQGLDGEGRQTEQYPALDPEALGLVREPVKVEVGLAGEAIALAVWRTDLAGVPLYLLDPEVGGNPEDVRTFTGTLYGGDRELRLRQEVMLGVGGPRALAHLGLHPTVFHLNEGHSALLALERVAALVEENGVDFDEALERVRASTVFTTHTPVPAGNEVFEAALAARYLAETASRCGVEVERLLALGRAPGQEHLFGLTPLALRTAARANAVSALHGDVSRRMWNGLGGEPAPAPIGHVTNGVHPGTWVAAELLGAELDPGELWRVHCERKRALLEEVERRTGAVLDRDALTIGFARRFAAYKRGGLILSDPDRLERLPVQLIVAGKAHPADEEGKAVLAGVTRYARESGRVVFLEDYDIALARLLVQGADVWLNTPRRPLEASGTSGMKAALNGVLNLSVLDGWWAEAYEPGVGWAIGDAEQRASTAEQDAADADSLYRVLEDEVVPAFLDRDADGLPRRWLELMAASITRLSPRFSSHRMVTEYVEQLYLPAHRESRAPLPV